LVEKSGSWFSYKGDRIGQGRENARQFLKDNQDIRKALDSELRKALGLVKEIQRTDPPPVAPDSPPEEARRVLAERKAEPATASPRAAPPRR
jgi:recombination protein RecA